MEEGECEKRQCEWQSLKVGEVVKLVEILELMDETLEARVREVQVLKVTQLGIEREIVTGSGGIESLR